MAMKVYAIGETLLDIIFEEHQVKAAKPGGSMLNSAVSLGRAGMDVSLITEFGHDQTGNLILRFLEKNHVQTRNIHLYKNGKTPLAMAFLNEKGDATYDFYKPYPKERLQVKIPDFTNNDILLFGSYFGIDPRVREKLLVIVKAAQKAGSMIVYDPNFRKPHAHELEKLRPYILENMQLAHIIRASHEDVKIIFDKDTIQDFQNAIQGRSKILIMTSSSEKVELLGNDLDEVYPVPEIKVVSSIGAGDNFNAGLIYGLIKKGVTISSLNQQSQETWKEIISLGMSFSADVCMGMENYISEGFASRMER
ncbi:MAG: carbohydrate kinase [Bacteroidales bacterium]|nr:carbohydrate kinase [Bacteroidales bacterium]